VCEGEADTNSTAVSTVVQEEGNCLMLSTRVRAVDRVQVVALPSDVTAYLQPDSTEAQFAVGSDTGDATPGGSDGDDNSPQRLTETPGASLVMRMLDVYVGIPARFNCLRSTEVRKGSVRADCVHTLHLRGGVTAYIQYSEVEGQYAQQLSGGRRSRPPSLVPPLALEAMRNRGNQQGAVGADGLTSRFALNTALSAREQQSKEQTFVRQLVDLFELADASTSGVVIKR
jgi:hypothetical protein